MADAYATFADLQQRWPGIPDSSRGRAEALLEDAAVILDAEKPPVPDPATGVLPDERVRRLVSCSMVERIMKNDGTAAGVTQGSRTMGPFSESVTYANPTGDLYLTKSERKLLGIGSQVAFSVSMAPAVEPVRPWWLL